MGQKDFNKQPLVENEKLSIKGISYGGRGENICN